MEVQEVKDKLSQVVATLQELCDEFKGGTTLGVLTQQVHADCTQSLRTANIVLQNVQEAEQAQEEPEVKEDLPKRAPSPASKADKSKD